VRLSVSIAAISGLGLSGLSSDSLQKADRQAKMLALAAICKPGRLRSIPM
jgi:hypothetical protein